MYGASSHVCFKRRSINKNLLDWIELSESKAVDVYFYLDSRASWLITNNMSPLRELTGEKGPLWQCPYMSKILDKYSRKDVRVAPVEVRVLLRVLREHPEAPLA